MTLTLCGQTIEAPPLGGVISVECAPDRWQVWWNKWGQLVVRNMAIMFTSESAVDRDANTGFWRIHDAGVELLRFDWYYQPGQPAQSHRVAATARPNSISLGLELYGDLLLDLHAWLDKCKVAFSPVIGAATKNFHESVTMTPPPGTVSVEAHVGLATISAQYTTSGDVITVQPRAAFDLNVGDFEAYLRSLDRVRWAVIDYLTGA